jgi:hypothetical protein
VNYERADFNYNFKKDWLSGLAEMVVTRNFFVFFFFFFFFFFPVPKLGRYRSLHLF